MSDEDKPEVSIEEKHRRNKIIAKMIAAEGRSKIGQLGADYFRAMLNRPRLGVADGKLCLVYPDELALESEENGEPSE